MNAKNEMTAEELVEELTRKTPQDEDPFRRDGVTITGKLNLQNQIIPVAVTLTNCTFTDEVDLRYSEFKQCVDFSGSRFKKNFNSCKTMYCKDLIFNGAIFEGDADFNSRWREEAIMNAKKIMTAEELEEELTRKTPQRDEFCRNDITIIGKLSLQNQIIPVAVTLTNCIFTDEVDLRYCEFKQCVDFSGSRFKKNFDSCKTMYCKDLIFNGAIFEDNADFNSLRCEGIGYFENAKFKNPKIDFTGLECKGTIYSENAKFDKKVNFVHARFGINLECQAATFQGDANFNSLKCEGTGNFEKTKFEHCVKDVGVVEVTFVHARFGINLECQAATFQGGASFNSLKCEGTGNFEKAKFKNSEKEINFEWATFGTNLNCNDANFNGVVKFNNLRCEGAGMFQNAVFEKEEEKKKIDFTHARFGGNLECQGAIFKGGASFNSLKCEKNGFFNGAKFKNTKEEINFEWATFGANLEYHYAIFKGVVKFGHLQCKGSGYFYNAQFKNKFEKEETTIDFSHARFGGNLECGNKKNDWKVIFQGGANFYGLQCEGSGIFYNAQFENEKKIDFTHASFGYDLECQEATFAGEVDFRHIQITGQIILYKTKFQNSVNFNCATIHKLSLRNPADTETEKTERDPETEKTEDDSYYPFKKEDVDLRRFTFYIFEGTKEQQKRIVEAQSTKNFSIDPYLQFERYYRSIGSEAEAKEVYYKGRCELRKSALSKENDEIQWSWWKKRTDWVLRWTVGYGVKMRFSLIWILVLLGLGTSLTFWPDNALVPEDAGMKQSGQTQIIEQLPYHLFYSLGLLIPIVNLRIVERYQYFHDWRVIYGVFHIMMGWILVSLLIASLLGIVKK